MNRGPDVHHTPVMVREVIVGLQVRPSGAYIDCTVGEGGHAAAVLNAADPAPRLLGIDLDAASLATAGRRLEAYGDRVTLAQGSFADLGGLDLGGLAEEKGFWPADGVLFDLGVSSRHLETADRGFSFRRSGPLDMRFDVSQGVTAHQVVNETSEKELADIIYQLGEERKARRFARAIVRARPVGTTVELAGVIVRSAGPTGRRGIHPATRVFQAVRIAVNRELDNLRQGLVEAVEVLRPGGRLLTISYHSLEDRLVKQTMVRESSSGAQPRLGLVSRRVVKPSKEEISANPRSRSARMRVAERL